MQDELLDLHESVGKTIIFITHDLDEALRIGDRIALMKDGNIVQIGTPEEILMNPSNEYVEKFVEDVDLSKVLTAGHIMKRAETVRVDKGPRVALTLMKTWGSPRFMLLTNTIGSSAPSMLKQRRKQPKKPDAGERHLKRNHNRRRECCPDGYL